MRLIVMCLALGAAANTAAAVYKWTKPDGSIVYSDRPPAENAAPADLPALQEIKMPPPPPAESPEAGANEQSDQSQAIAYTQLAITEPAADSVIRDNSGQVNVKLALEPPLQDAQGDTISILLDGKEIGQGKSTALSLSNVDRGTHTLQAVVKNADGDTLITSSSVSFNLMRTSVLQRKP